MDCDKYLFFQAIYALCGSHKFYHTRFDILVFSPLTVNPMQVCFIDKGVPYDPLKKEDPNTKLPIEERDEGGLGIYMVKKTMDEVTYSYKDGQNILTIKKNI